MSDENQVVEASAKVKKHRTNYHVSDERFVAAWQASDSTEAVGEALNMPPKIVLSRAAVYRRNGVDLKKMPRKTNRGNNVERLNAIVAATQTA
jgi:hypothetical protein